MAADSFNDNPLDQLRLSLMQDVLPVGLAVLERARSGGPGRVVEAFTTGSKDPLSDLREEGEPVARSVRDQLDSVSPGLGNPVMPVSVNVEEQDHQERQSDERLALMEALQRIEGRLEDLRRLLPGE